MSIRVRRILRWLGYGFGAFAILLLIGGLAGWRWMRAALPPQHAEVRLAGISGTVGIRRVEVDGIPTISAGNELDAFFGLGWVHAEDRLWQMDFQRRAASGRLSEVLGARTLDIDKFTRTLGLMRAAEASLKQMSPAMRAVLEAYAGGVNAWIEHHRGPLPPEFLILGYRPDPWRPVDTVLWGQLMALELSDNYHGELARARIASVLTPEEMAQLFPRDDGAGPTTIDTAAHGPASRLAGALPSLGELPGFGAAASNAWVLSGARTKTGKPILANDPHLGLSAPILWYLARIETPTLTMAGATAPGVPAVLIGHNRASRGASPPRTATRRTCSSSAWSTRIVTPVRGPRFLHDAHRAHPGQGRGPGRDHRARDPARAGALRCQPYRRRRCAGGPCRRARLAGAQARRRHRGGGAAHATGPELDRLPRRLAELPQPAAERILCRCRRAYRNDRACPRPGPPAGR